ncbi:MAG: YihY/virulence factor BrkB family protein [Actinomycetia bacterium]|nr:YihY/virulence factor BrkB family protein [Actinomycetes bacterium]
MGARFRHWYAIARDVRREIQHDNVVIIAAGVAFYAVLALLPAMFVIISLYGLFTDTADVEHQITQLLTVFPDSATVALTEQMRAIADASHANLSIGFAISTLALIWTVSNATRAMVGAVKIAYDQEDQRSVLESRATAMGLTLFVMVGIVIALAAIAVVPAWLRQIDPTNIVSLLANLRWLFLAATTTLTIGLLYRFAPPVRPERWADVLPGAVIATVVWSMASIGFSLYVSSFGNYNATYGTLGGAVVLLLWFWFSALAIILGAEVNESIDRLATASSSGELSEARSR